MVSLIYEMKNEDEEVKHEQSSLTARTHITTLSNVLSLEQQNLPSGNKLVILAAVRDHQRLSLALLFPPLGELICVQKSGEGELMYCTSLLCLCVSSVGEQTLIFKPVSLCLVC